MRVGTSGWAYRSWIGPFYPPGTAAARMLETYAGLLSTVEAHSTHRRTPTAAAVANWAAAVPDGFRFAPKAHAAITHRRDTSGLDERAGAFLASLAALGERLGPVLLVLPHRQPDLARLDELLSALAGRCRAVFELAPAWRSPEVLDRLEAAGASLAVVDREDDDGRDQPFHGPVAYLRLRRPAYSEAAIGAWAERLALASEAGRDAYAFFRHDEEGYGPRYARDLVKCLERG